MKKNRTIQASDLEWEKIRARAKDAGMNVSNFIMACAEFSEDEQVATSEALSNAEMRHLYDLVQCMAEQQAVMNNPVEHVKSYISGDKRRYLFNLRQVIHAIFLILKVQEWRDNGGR